MIDEHAVKCPKCKNIMTHYDRGYHCGVCGRYFMIACDVIVEVSGLPEVPHKNPDEDAELCRIADLEARIVKLEAALEEMMRRNNGNALGAEAEALQERVQRLEFALLDIAGSISDGAWRRAAGTMRHHGDEWRRS